MPLSPYFEGLARAGRICPRCRKRPTYMVESSMGNPNGAYERCECGYFQSMSAPKSAQMSGWDPRELGMREGMLCDGSGTRIEESRLPNGTTVVSRAGAGELFRFPLGGVEPEKRRMGSGVPRVSYSGKCRILKADFGAK